MTRKRIVETYLDTVRGQEQNTLEVFQLPQENADKSIAVDVMHVALLEEHISLIKEEDGAPGMADVEDLLEL